MKIHGTFNIYNGLNLLFILTNPSIELIRKFKYEKGLNIIPVIENFVASDDVK